MRPITIELDDETFQRVQQLAERHSLTVEEMITSIISRAGIAGATSDALWGLFSDEPELVNQVFAAAMQARKRDPLRQKEGDG
jgi:predicted transcriptional regulator